MNTSDWDQCDHCAKMVHVSELNADGICPECAADDGVVAGAEEQELQTAYEIAGDDPTCPHCGVRFNTDDWFMPLECPVCGHEITGEPQSAGDEQDERDLERITREWSEYDRDPPGS